MVIIRYSIFSHYHECITLLIVEQMLSLWNRIIIRNHVLQRQRNRHCLAQLGVVINICILQCTCIVIYFVITIGAH